jgi:outer membrane murein-binding lipoprotein Lpp
MLVSVFDELARELEGDPAKRHALRALLLTEELLALPATVAELVGIVKELTEVMAAVLLRLDHLETDVSTLKTDVATLKTDVATLKTDVATLKTDVATLKTDVATLKTDVATLKTDVGTLKTDVATLKTDVATLKTDVGTLKTDVGTLKTDVGTLKGSDLERHWQRHLPAYLGRQFRRLLIIEPADLRELLDEAVDAGRIELDEAIDAALADVVGHGRRQDGAELYVAVEASVVVDANDVKRALRRARILARATGAGAHAVAAGDRATKGALEFAALPSDVPITIAGPAGLRSEYEASTA